MLGYATLYYFNGEPAIAYCRASANADKETPALKPVSDHALLDLLTLVDGDVEEHAPRQRAHGAPCNDTGSGAWPRHALIYVNLLAPIMEQDGLSVVHDGDILRRHYHGGSQDWLNDLPVLVADKLAQT